MTTPDLNKFGFNKVTTDQEEIFNDKDTNSIVIATRHDSHAKYILKALENGKNVFVEKPLCINLEDLKKIIYIHKQKKNKIYINLPNLNDERFLKLKKIITSVYKKNKGSLKVLRNNKFKIAGVLNKNFIIYKNKELRDDQVILEKFL